MARANFVFGPRRERDERERNKSKANLHRLGGKLINFFFFRILHVISSHVFEFFNFHDVIPRELTTVELCNGAMKSLHFSLNISANEKRE